jgi:hypothetical protein
MKKLLAILFILTAVSSANATISMTLSGDSTPGSGIIDLYVVPSATGQLDLSMAICLKGTGTLSAGTLGASAPTDSEDAGVDMAGMDAALGTSLVATYGNGEIWSMMSYTSVYPTGVWLTVTYSGIGADAVITAYQSADGNFDDVDMQSNSLMAIPEPATIALLCIGGLMLRRKK